MAKKQKKEKTSRKEKEREYNAKYYRENKEKIQKRKRERYRNDPKYRERQRALARTRYFLRRRKESEAKIPNVPLKEVAKEHDVLTISFPVTDKKDARYGKEVEVEVFTSSAVVELLGKSSSTIARWINQDLLAPYWTNSEFPGLVKGSNVRLFTKDEMQVLEDCREHLAVPYRKLENSMFLTMVRDRFADLHQGIQRKEK